MRRALLTLAAAVALAVLAGTAAAATGSPQLVESGGVFPDRQYALTLPQKQQLNARNVVVTENGQPVDGLAVIAPGADSSTILAIDASNSMAGAPIAGAMRAARAFAANRNPNTRMGVVFFNDDVTVALQPTRDRSEIASVLSRQPDLDEGTHIYDAVGEAVNQVEQTGSRVSSVVLLTDGDDVGSTASETIALDRLRAASARVFTVGLRSSAYSPETLRRLADETGGTHAETGSANALEPILSQLGSRLANEYQILYRSLQAAETPVKVAVRVPGYRTIRASYTTPPLALSSGPAEKSTFDEVLQSWLFMLLLVLAIVGLLVYAVRTILDLRRRSVRRRIGEFVEMGSEDVSLLSREELTLRLRDFEQSIERSGWMARFAEKCEIGFVKQPPMTLLLGSFAASAFIAVILGALWSPFAILLFPVGPILVVLYVNRRVATQRKLFAEQLPDNLDVLAQGLRVGHSLIGGLSHMADDASEPSRREFRRVVTDEQLGIPLEDAMKKVAARMENRDMEHVALVAMLQRETGGASAEVIDQVSTNIRGRMEVRRLVKTLTAQGRLARWIVSLMPLALVLMILIIFPKYLDPLFHEALGIAALVIASIMVICGSLVIKRIVDIKV